MKTSAAGRALIEAFEGLYLKTYDDGTGVLTIGYGHTTAAGSPSVKWGMKINEADADKMLSDDLTKVERNVQLAIEPAITQSQFDALVSFDFNTGSLKKGSIDDKINAGKPAAAMATLLQYTHAGGREMAGLVRRRKAEKLLFEGNITSALKLAGAHMNSGDVMPQAPQPAPKPVPIPPPPPDVEPTPTPQVNRLAALMQFVKSLFARK